MHGSAAQPLKRGITDTARTINENYKNKKNVHWQIRQKETLDRAAFDPDDGQAEKKDDWQE
jgi:hypothetical protein